MKQLKLNLRNGMILLVTETWWREFLLRLEKEKE